MSYLTAPLTLLRRLRDRRDGTVAMIFGLMFIPVLITAAGMAVDVTRIYDARVRLTAALDDAALAVAATSTTAAAKSLSATALQTELNNQLTNYVKANYPLTAIGRNVSATMSDPTLPIINLAATATIDMTFMKILNFPSVTINVASQVTKGISGLELALVLDNTGSMLFGDGGLSDCSSGVPPSHITTLIDDANQIVDTLFATSADTSKLKIALVPYVTTVNVGTEFCSGASTCSSVAMSGSSFLDIHGNVIKDLSNSPITFDTTQTENTREWKGCVIEPTTANEDSNGNGPDFTEPVGGWSGPWNAFYWKPNTYSSGTNSWTNSTIRYLHDDGQVLTDWSNSKGPNNGCPTPIVRLTSDQTTLNNAISAMKAWDASGTQIHIGMIWGWRVLSPNPPFSDTQPYAPSGTTLNANGWIKAVVLETDGENELPDAKHLTGLSFLADGKFGTTVGCTSSSCVNTGLSHLDTRLQKVCQNMLAQGIVIYTIGLGSTAASNTTLQNCAGNGGKFYAAPTGADLSAAFSAIATSLNNLRLSK